MPETYKNFLTILGTTAATDVYPGVTGTAIINSINISNINLFTAVTASINLVRGSTGYSIARNISIPTATTFQSLDAPMVLQSSDKLTLTAGSTGSLHAIISVLEIT
jgi:hypothetical protein